MLERLFPAQRRILGYVFVAIISTGSIALAGEAPRVENQGNLKPPPVPTNIQVPSGNVVYMKGFAIGTQNYVCVPEASGPVWKFLGPQATLFTTLPWVPSQPRWQIMTHFLSPNPMESGTPRPTWQSSQDSSAVWGKAIAQSTDSKYVAAGAIPWLLVEIVGSQQGPAGDSGLVGTTYIQRVNTSGGVAPSDGCDATTYGKVAFSPYTTDYYFYRAGRSR